MAILPALSQPAARAAVATGCADRRRSEPRQRRVRPPQRTGGGAALVARIGIEVVNDEVTMGPWWRRSGSAIRFVDRATDRAGEGRRATRDDREAVEEAERIPAGFRLVRVRGRGLFQ